MLFFSTILSPEHVYIHNISQFKSFVNSQGPYSVSLIARYFYIYIDIQNHIKLSVRSYISRVKSYRITPQRIFLEKTSI